MKREVLTAAGLSAAAMLLAFGPAIAQTNRGGAKASNDVEGGAGVSGDVKGSDVKGGAGVKGGDNMPSASPNTSTDVKGDIKGDVKGGVDTNAPSASPRIDDSTTRDNASTPGDVNSDRPADKLQQR